MAEPRVNEPRSKGPLRVLVLGASGSLGAVIAARLHAAGHVVIGASRRRGEAFARWSDYGWIRADLSADESVSAWRPRLYAIDVVVNAALIAREARSGQFEATLATGSSRLYAACAQFAVARVIHLIDLGWRGGETAKRIAAARVAEHALGVNHLDASVVEIAPDESAEHVAARVAGHLDDTLARLAA